MRRTPPPCRRSAALTLVAALVATISLVRTSHASWPQSPVINVPVCTAAGHQVLSVAVSDGAGGLVVAWQDSRSGSYDIYAQHLLASGSVDPAWPADGSALCTAANDQDSPRIVSDGAGGAIVTWDDLRGGGSYDVYAQRVLASGVVDPAWPSNGLVVCNAAFSQFRPVIVSDGAGGALIAWDDSRDPGDTDIYVQHVLASGAADPVWPVNGRAVCTATNTQMIPLILPDGFGGAIVAWQDSRSGTNSHDIYAQRVLFGGTVDPAWPVNGRALCTAANMQAISSIISDGAGGAIVVWQDNRSGDGDIYALRVLSSGTVSGAWPGNGQALCTAANNQSLPNAIPDGAGGAIVAWEDRRSGSADIYIHHVSATGVVDPAWPADGRAVCTAGNEQNAPGIVTDGAGGAFLTWQDNRSSNYDVYSHHVLATGVVDPFWPVNGREVGTATGHQFGPAPVSDLAGRVILVWYDFRSGVSYDLYAQMVDPSGSLGLPGPELVNVLDVPGDNGGYVEVTWNSSYFDLWPPYTMDHYWVFRSVPPNLAARALRAGARLLRAGDSRPRPGERVFLEAGGIRGSADYFWEYVGEVPADHDTPVWTLVSPTTSDSMAASNPLTAFIVVAYNAENDAFFASNPDSGYSVDDLAPLAPEAFEATVEVGALRLRWLPSPAPDLAGYRLYRGSASAFAPGPANLIASPVGTEYMDDGPAGSWYKLSAVDVHGNESGFAVLAPSGTVAIAAGSLPRAISLSRPAPNPTLSLCTARLALPRSTRVRLAVLDVAGRRVCDLLVGVVAAGERDVAWGLRDAAGTRVAEGLYFMRLDVDGETISRRVAVVR